MSVSRLPPLNALRAFEAVARLRSFRKAADELFVTPAAVTHQIKALEDQLGLALFLRLNRRIQLTPAAMEALPRFQQAFELMAQGVAELRGHGKTPTLTVRATPTFTSRWMMPRLQNFLSVHPGIDVHILASGQWISATSQEPRSEEISDSETSADIDIQFSNGRPEGDFVDLLFSVEVVPMCHPRLLSGAEQLGSVNELSDYNLLHADGVVGDRSRSTWAQWLRHAGATGVDHRRGLRFDHSTLALEAAADGLGVTLAMPLLASAELRRGDVKVIFPVAMPLEKSYYAVTDASARNRPEVAAFRQWLTDEAESAVKLQQTTGKKRGR